MKSRRVILADTSIQEEYIVELWVTSELLKPSISLTIATPKHEENEDKYFPSNMEALVFYKHLIDSLRMGGAYHVRESKYAKDDQ